MATKTIGIKEDVYERLKTHKRRDESFSDTLDRILRERNSDWRTHAGFLTDAEATALEAAVDAGRSEADGALEALGDDIEAQFQDE